MASVEAAVATCDLNPVASVEAAVPGLDVLPGGRAHQSPNHGCREKLSISTNPDLLAAVPVDQLSSQEAKDPTQFTANRSPDESQHVGSREWRDAESRLRPPGGEVR
jgi:hypothetical protein